MKTPATTEKRKHTRKSTGPVLDSERERDQRLEAEMQANVADLKSKGPFQIIELYAENFKKLKVVRVKPTGGMVQISGENGSGKSSVLDAIELLLMGTTNIPSKPVRKGAARAVIATDLGPITITRRMLEDGTKGGVLEVWSKDQKRKLQSAQSVLDALMGTISFDPLEFMRMEPRKQLETLRKLSGVDLTEIDAEIKQVYDDRRVMGRDKDALQVRAEGMTVPANLPSERPDIAGLTAKLREAGNAQALRERVTSQQEALRERYERQVRRSDELKQTARDLRAEIEALEARATKADADAEEAFREGMTATHAADAITVPEPVDTEPIEQEIAAANAVNLGITRREAREAVMAELEEKLKAISAHDERLEKLRAQRVDAIAAGKMPVEGLGFGEGEVTYDDLPYDQASDAAQIRVAVALAMAANPTIRVLRIKDGSLLDAKNMDAIAKMAEANNYQVWVERVDTSGKVGIVMEDGEVASDGE